MTVGISARTCDDRRRRAAVALGATERFEIVARFFGARPGPGREGLGLGRAVGDFLDWEIRSGRVADIGGSDWWRVMNGVMMLDLRDAADLLDGNDPSATPAPSVDGITAWVGYARADENEAQAAMWDAHRTSLAEGARLAAPFLGSETPEEQAFCGIVLDVVDKAAVRRVATDTDELARLTEQAYPAVYPIGSRQLDLLVAGLRRGRRS